MLNLRQIEAFRATIEGRSVTAASRAMNVSQPSVSRLLHDLESALGFALFTRHRRGMVPTNEAQLFYAEVERSFLGLQELEASAHHIREFKSSRLTLGVSPAMALEFVPALVAQLSARQPQVGIAMHVSDSSRLLGRVRSGRVSLALMSPIEWPEDVDVLAQRSFPYVAVLRADHPLAQTETELDVTCLEPGATILPVASFMATKCKNPDVAARLQEVSNITVEMSSAAVSMVHHGLGIALIDPFTARYFSDDARLICKPFRDAPSFDVVIAQPRHVTASPLQNRFVAKAIERLDQPLPALG